jgi:hypothetical protein
MKQEAKLVELKSFGDALRKSILHYRWIARHGGYYSLKAEYFTVTKKPVPDSKCYLCEWSIRREVACTNCIKYKVWNDIRTGCPCLDKLSPYMMWVTPHPTTVKGALLIVKTLRAALKRYNKENKTNG